jgi:membrane fusion protein (multidrug efflux system)
MNPRFAVVGASLAMLATLLSSCGKSEAPAAAKGAGGAQPAPEVTVVTLQPRQVVLTTELAGRTSAFRIAEVRPQVSGILKERVFREGSTVAAGAALYRIDPATYAAEVERAQAALAKAEANVATARLKAERYEELVTIDAVSKQARDDAAVALKQAEADVAAARAALAAAKINLGYTTVTAPIGGQIGRSALTPGALVTANQATALATIQQLDPIYVDVTQSSADLMRMRRDLAAGVLKSAGPDQARVKLLLEDGSAYPLEGRLQFSEVSVDPASGSVTLRAVFPNPKQLLLPGMYVRAVLEEGVRENALAVPQQGITRDARGNAMALVVAADGTVQQRVVRADRALGAQWLVSDGLAAGDRVIVEGLQKVRPGAPARAVERVETPAGAATAAPAAAHAATPAAGGDKPAASAAKAASGAPAR